MKNQKRFKFTAVMGLLSMCLFSTSCKIEKARSGLVDVKIVSVWTTKEYKDNWSLSTKFPHTIVEEVETQERHWVEGDTWGEVGDTFKMDAGNL